MNCNFPDCKRKAIYANCFLGMSLCKKHKVETDQVAKMAEEMSAKNPEHFNKRVQHYMQEIENERNNNSLVKE